VPSADQRVDADGAGPGADAAPLPCLAAGLAPLALDEAYCVTARAQLPQPVPAGLALRGDAVWTFAAAGAKTFQVRRWLLDAGAQLLIAPVNVLTHTAQRAEDLFPSEYLAVHEGTVAVGYNTTDFASPQGAVLWGAAGVAPQEHVAAGNYDAVFFDGDTLLVDGLGAGELKGQGVYALRRGLPPRRLIGALGDNSAPLLLGARVLFAGGFFLAEGKTKLFGFTREAIAAALASGAELSAAKDGALVAEGSYFDAAPLGDDLVLVLADAEFEYAGVTRIPVSVGAGGLAPQAPRVVVPPPVAGAAGEVKRLAEDGPRLALVFTDATGATQLAVIGEAGGAR
jgi:hypothetical protein